MTGQQQSAAWHLSFQSFHLFIGPCDRLMQFLISPTSWFLMPESQGMGSVASAQSGIF